MKQTLFTLLVILFSKSLDAQAFNFQDFDNHVETAEYLCAYDKIAWWTSDVVVTEDKEELAKLNRIWFCLPFEDSWRAYYGYQEGGDFIPVFQYEVDSSNQVKRIFEPRDSVLLNPLSRALSNAFEQMESSNPPTALRFNQYIRKTEKDEIEVWILPAFQPSSTAVFGGEFYYKYDSSGNELMTKEIYLQDEYRGFKVDEPREIWLDYTDIDEPTIGAVFFVMYYKNYFTSINLETSKSISTLVSGDGTYNWVHILKETKKKRKKKRKG